MSIKPQGSRLELLRNRAVNAALSFGADAKLAPIYDEVEAEFGAEEAELLRTQIGEARRKMPFWMPLAISMSRKVRPWRAFVLIVLLSLVVFLVYVFAMGGF